MVGENRHITTRNSKVELLRILSMLFIVVHHFSYHGPLLDWKGDSFSIQLAISQFYWSVGKIGVDVFVLITGYFLWQARFSLKRVLRICLQVMFYSVVIYFATGFLGFHSFSLRGIIHAFFPVSFYYYWFVSCYVLLLLLLPLFNLFIRHTTLRQVLTLTGMFLMISFLLPSLFRTVTGSLSPFRIFTLYFVGAIIGKYREQLPAGILAHPWRIIVLNLTIIWGSLIVLDTLGVVTGRAKFLVNALRFSEDTSVFIIGVSVGLLFWAVQGEKRIWPGINRVSSLVFGVYLFHDNPYIQAPLWNLAVFNNPWLKGSALQFLGVSLLVIALIFVSGIIVEFLRQSITRRFEAKSFEVLGPSLRRFDQLVEPDRHGNQPF